MLKTIGRHFNKCYDLKIAFQRNIFSTARLKTGTKADKPADTPAGTPADTPAEETVEPEEKKKEIDCSVLIEKEDKITLIGINRPEKKNAINAKTAASLCDAFRNFENDETSAVAVLYGRGSSFCSGYDLEELGDDKTVSMDILMTAEGSVGPTRRHITKPVICAINGYCVANGLELALMCDLRVMENTAILGFFNRRLSVPLIDGGTARLSAIIGFSRALDLILTGRRIESKEALQIGLVNRVVACGTSLGQAVNMAQCIAKFPQASVRHDRNSLYSATFDAQGFSASIQNEIMLTSQDIIDEMQKGIKAFNESDVKGPKCCSKLYQEPLPEWEQQEIDYEKQYEEMIKKDREKRESERKEREKKEAAGKKEEKPDDEKK